MEEEVGPDLEDGRLLLAFDLVGVIFSWWWRSFYLGFQSETELYLWKCHYLYCLAASSPATSVRGGWRGGSKNLYSHVITVLLPPLQPPRLEEAGEEAARQYKY